MAGAKGSALEWALALLRAPGERHALRRRALPGGVDTLLAIAAESNTAAIADAARRLGESPERLLEAARFYVREVLFHREADAYRVLGLTPEASTETLKAHHRLLQHWLHPDRLRSADDSIFAARVNTAWNLLRTPERRQAYDRARLSEPVPEVIDTRAGLGRSPGWTAALPLEVAPPLPRWRRRLPVYVLLLACSVLAWLGVRDAATQPDLAAWESASEAAGEVGSPVLHLPVRAPAGVQVRGRIARERQQAGDVPTARVPVATAANSPKAPVAPGRPTVAAVFPKPAIPPAPSAQPVVLVTKAPVPVPRPQSEPSMASTVQFQPPASSPTVVSPVPPSRVPAATPVAASGIARQPAAASSLEHGADAEFARVQQARRAGEQLLRYMAAPGRVPPPIWNSPAIQSSADQLRQELHQGGRQQIGSPQWRIGARTAALRVQTRVPDGEGQGKGPSRLSADMIWREGRWLVTGLSVEQVQ